MNTHAIIQHIVTWLKHYATQAQMRGFVVGVSGGIDSAVVSTLCAHTGLEVLCLDLPIRQKEDQLQRAHQHIDFLKEQFTNVHHMSVDLTSTFEQFESISSNTATSKQRDLALANTRSRLRMMTLYYYGQINHLLVTGTGNKVEDFGVGFFTKYGDGGVDISPIADLLKSQVTILAKALGISNEIISATPTDGLWDNERTDEQQMGATYPELEWAMQQQANGKTHDDFHGREQEVFDIYTRLNRAAQHKIRPIPICTIPLHYFNTPDNI